MKKLLVALVLSIALIGTGIAYAKRPHPNLTDAHELVRQALKKLDSAQTAHEHDLQGHAAKAKELLTEAQGEIEASIKAADEDEKKKK